MFFEQSNQQREVHVSGHHFDKCTASLFTQNTTLITNILPMLFKQSSQQREEWSGHHFDEHTISLFILKTDH